MRVEDLLERGAQGDEEALGLLYEIFYPKIFGYLYQRLQDPSLCEDLTSETFLRILESLRKEENRPKYFRAWMYRIAHNLMIDHIRRAKLKMFVSWDSELLQQLASSESDLFEHAVQQEIRERIEWGLNCLTASQEDAIRQRFFSGYSIRETAQNMNNTEQGVKGLQRRGLLELRERLGANKRWDVGYETNQEESCTN